MKAMDYYLQHKKENKSTDYSDKNILSMNSKAPKEKIKPYEKNRGLSFPLLSRLHFYATLQRALKSLMGLESMISCKDLEFYDYFNKYEKSS